MKIQEIKEIAQKMDIAPGKLKKSDLVRVIQQKEGNTECFETGQAKQCGQENCSWRDDCK